MTAGFAFHHAGPILEAIGLRPGERPHQDAHVREYRGHLARPGRGLVPGTGRGRDRRPASS